MYLIKRLIPLSEFKHCVAITPEKVLNNYKKTVETLEVKFSEFSDVGLYYNLSEDCEYMIYEIKFSPYFTLSEDQENAIKLVDISRIGCIVTSIPNVSSRFKSIVLDDKLVWIEPEELKFYISDTVLCIKMINNNRTIYQKEYSQYYQISKLIERLIKLGVTNGGTLHVI